jgi:hypothetical protein
MKNDWTQRNSRYLRVDSNGAWYTVDERLKPVNPVKLIDEFVKKQGFLSPMLAPGSYAFFKGKITVLMQVVTEVPFRTEMMIDKASIPAEGTAPDENCEIRYLPAFGKGGLEVDPPFMYTPPDSMRLVFCSRPMTGATPYLIAQHRETGKTYHPILPNVYNDGKICTGTTPETEFNEMTGFGPFIDGMLTEWSASKWNADLLGSGGSRPQDWLKFDSKTKCNIIPDEAKDPWTNYSSLISPPPEYAEAVNKIHELFSMKEEEEGLEL